MATLTAARSHEETHRRAQRLAQELAMSRRESAALKASVIRLRGRISRAFDRMLSEEVTERETAPNGEDG